MSDVSARPEVDCNLHFVVGDADGLFEFQVSRWVEDEP